MWKEVVKMDYRELRKLKIKLLHKINKTDSEVQLLAELHSLSLSTEVCKACGRPL